MRTQFTARPTTYNGIQMRSRLEAGFAAWLDHWHFDWEYEPGAFASSLGQYLPDFVLHGVRCAWLRAPAEVYVETKPVYPDDFEPLMRSMAVIWDSEPDGVLLLVVREGEGEKKGSPDVAVLSADSSPNFSDPRAFPWPTNTVWTTGHADGRLGLAYALTHPGGLPWFGDYWKVTT